MNCEWSKELLALHVEGDLPADAAQELSRHLATCRDCARDFETLTDSQSRVKSLRLEKVLPTECTVMRRQVMAVIADGREESSWVLRLERLIALGVQRRAYAVSAVVFLGIASVTVLAQLRQHRPEGRNPPAVEVETRDTMIRPEGYRRWVLVTPQDSGTSDVRNLTRGSTGKVYISPTSYREYTKTGKFPEGTLMVWEAVQTGNAGDEHHRRQSVMLASIKDSSRFNTGWGYFDFTAPNGAMSAEAQALPESNACRTCHLRNAETDQVFTQFYPRLRSALQGTDVRTPRAST